MQGNNQGKKVAVQTKSSIVQNDLVNFKFNSIDNLQKIYIESALKDKTNRRSPVFIEEYNCYILMNTEEQIELLLLDFERLMSIPEYKLYKTYKLLKTSSKHKIKSLKKLSMNEDVFINSFMQAIDDEILSINELIVLMKIIDLK